MVEQKFSEGAFLTKKDEIKFVLKPPKTIPWIQGVVENEGAIRAAGKTFLNDNSREPKK